MSGALGVVKVNFVREIESGKRTLLAVVKVLPASEDLEQEVADAMAAQQRGYYLPDEDERLREVFASYLDIRSALRELLAEMEPLVDEGRGLDVDERLRVFIVGYCAACLLVRSGSYIIRIADGKNVVAEKLDEAEPRYGIPRKSFTEIYRLQSSVQRMWKFYSAWCFYDEYRARIRAMADDEQVGELVAILKREEPFMEKRRREFVGQRFRYRLHSFLRRNKSGYENTMFHLLAIGGRTVSELRDPTKGLVRSPKRVPGKPLQAIREFLKPGDILVTRHRDALTNVFLPGYWPHAALYVGEREGGNVVEAKKDGVLLRELAETLSVDEFVVMRAEVGEDVLETVVSRALSHVGKLFDFSFDFRQAARMACTAVIYRSWHGQGGIEFSLTETSGKLCLPAEKLIDQALGSGLFKVVGFFGEGCGEVSLGEEAARKFKR
ncbi:MAG: YiiX/YebB-like N1pC/P60 family cysteine hydrolase [Akkermansiaceae bacterium]|nr:YiiX/YebB-like N1pC/P60 family cysteine hydrolase [Akkermansiaceae bacterium]MDP4647635.1 YiiX/YebB-like N1pC/P60 family cysteine hydrolase [Akkermansiaceae bacterium]MDP4780347.1 YiiX/YebB-like N1pC/P60 family cysteine hydrolase [Akkermansiaceae bacterium]MDP4846170.1 YiiX/YebB-like N1pC/P60 family cysteine hydrolase [Akkermansiaceae bacterium]MDP4898639.1 YiiX/YebB-like N1pC/P60 family cysteine hydrolase [Akkermansiaceae bacterium]